MRKANRLLAISLVLAMLMAIVPFGMFNTFAATSDANLLSGKTPVISGSGVGYWDEANGGVSYRANLTDNTIAEGFTWTGNEWFGLYYGTDTAGINAPNGVGTFSFDLGGKYSLSKLAVHLWNTDDATSGIAAPASIVAYVSNDNGATYTKLDNAFAISTEAGVAYWSAVELSDVIATNVKFEIKVQSSFVMLDEIQAFGTEYVEDNTVEPGILTGKTPAISGSGVGYADDTVSFRANLTDGIIAEDFTWAADEWFGLFYGTQADKNNVADNLVGTISFDLGKAYSLNKLAVHIWSGMADSGIESPESITAYASTDNGATYTAINATFAINNELGNAYWSTVELTDVKATNLKFEFKLKNTYVMIDEICAYGEETTITTPDPEPEPEPEPDTPTSIIKDKAVAISGNGVGAWDSETDGAIKYRAKLTDGVTSNGMNWVDNEWFGFYYGDKTGMLNTVNGVGVATIDLGGAYALSKVSVHVFAGDSDSGISAPVINAFYSMDNGSSYLPMQGQFVAVATDGSAFWAEMALTNTKATHIKFEFTAQTGSFVMIDEIEAYGEATTITDEEIQQGGATVEEKETLRLAIEAAKKVSYKSYSVTALENIRKCYDKAVEMLNSTTATKEECDAKAKELTDLLNVKANILSIGKRYYTTAPYRGDDWDDDGIRLTDGKKCVFDGGEYAYSGWKEEAFITIDLGTAMESDTYTMYLAAGTWGIALPMPKSFKIEVLYSNDNQNFTSLGFVPKLEHTGGATAYSDELNAIWGTFQATLTLDAPISARYIKFYITNEECVGFIWTDEVEVSLGETSISGGVYVTGMNEKVDNGECVIFTSSFNNGVVDVANGGINWTTNVIAKWNTEKNAYIVTKVTHGSGPDTPSVTIADDEILIAAHAWDGEVENPVVGSGNNVKQVYNVREGDMIKISGVDIENEYYSVAPYLVFSASEEIQEKEYYHIDVKAATCTKGSYCNACGNTLSDPLGHRDVEEATCLLGEYCNDCDTYISDPLGHRDVDEATCLLGEYCNDCETYISSALGHDEGEWTILDDGSQELRCTRCGHLLDTKPAPEKDTHIYYGLRGDINFNDKIDARDYLLLKRGYFGTYFLDEGATYRADINENGKVDARDYLLLKRAYFRTYEIPNPYVYIEIVEE